MKNIILIVGFFLVVVNTAIGLIFSDYPSNNMIFADISILLTMAVMYTTSQSKIPDGFKIGFSLLFIILGILRLICAFVSPNHPADNLALLVFILLVGVEWVLVFIGHAMRDK